MNFFKGILSTLTAILIFFILVLLVIVSLLSSDESDLEIRESSVLHIKLKKNIVDRQNSSDFSLFNRADCGNSLIEIHQALIAAKKDTAIKGIFLEIGQLSGSLANISSLKRDLKNFRKSGRKVIAYSDGLTQTGYYLASSADSIFTNHLTNIEWKGLSAQVMYFKSMLDQIGIEAEPIRAGKFKSAIEPFILDSMSSQNEFQLSEMLNDIWSGILSDISLERDISKDKLNIIANEFGYLMSKEALELGLVDGIKYEDEVFKCLDGIVGHKTNLISVQDFNKIKTKESESDDKIVVVNAEGAIVDADTEKDISSIKYSKIFDDILKDKSVKGVVLRINSPGGSALASEKLWRKLKLINSKLPLVVSMGNYAASGGYYMACAADSILAEKNTITGSIGVFGLLFNFSKLTGSIGVKVEKVKTNDMSDFPAFDRKLSKTEKNRISNGINAVYATFKKRVQDGRSLNALEVDQLAEGRVWTGNQALKLGLVDKLGGLEDAILIAANSAETKDYEVLHLPKLKSKIESIVSEFSNQTQLSLPQPFTHYNYVIQNPYYFKDFTKPQARLPFVIKID